MSKTIILIHGRAPKPTKRALRGLWLDALRHGLDRDHGDKLAEFDRARVEFIYYGDINNDFLVPQGHDVHADAASRRTTLARLKQYTKGDFFIGQNYERLPGKNSKLEFTADALAGIASFFRVSEPVIHLVAPDMKQYWNQESDFGSKVRFPMINPLRRAMDRDDSILVIAHSLGTMIAYDTFGSSRTWANIGRDIPTSRSIYS